MRAPLLGHNEIKQLLRKHPTEIVRQLNQSIANLRKTLNLKDAHTSDDFVCNLICVLARACEAPRTEELNTILAALKGSVFLKESVNSYLERAQSREETSEEKVERKLFEDLIKLFSAYLRRLPSSYADVPVGLMQRTLDQLRFEGKEEVQDKLKALKEERDDAIKADADKRKYNKPHKGRNASQGKPPNDFREIPVCPKVSEVVSDEKPFLRKHVIEGKYEDAEHYLDVQFRLFREDFLSPLREGIHEVARNVPRQERKQNVKLYHRVRILGKDYTRSGIIFKVKFDVSQFKFTRWASSKRLIFGSFLCLSRDNFKTMLFATVANRDPKDLYKGIFDLRFLEGQDVYGIEARHEEEYVMAESPAYFESYRHVLSGLQEMDEDNLPFKKYLVECSPDVDPPQYLRREEGEEPARYDLRKTLRQRSRALVPILQPDAWPSARALALNESQLDAFKTALTREFSVIQGPPGTGKTYVGAKIVQCLLNNRHIWDPQRTSPMLMVCYTNHALDQFLEKVLEFLKRGIIRVGGRSKSEQLEQFNLKLFVRHFRSGERREVYRKMESSVEVLKEKKKALRSLGNHILAFEDLEIVMDERLVDQLYRRPQRINVAQEDICEVYKIWLCHKETQNPRDGWQTPTTVEDERESHRIIEDTQADDAEDEYVSAEEEEVEEGEEGGEEEFVDAMDYPWPFDKIHDDTAGMEASHVHLHCNLKEEHQRIGDNNVPCALPLEVMENNPKSWQIPSGPANANIQKNVAPQSRNDTTARMVDDLEVINDTGFIHVKSASPQIVTVITERQTESVTEDVHLMGVVQQVYEPSNHEDYGENVEEISPHEEATLESVKREKQDPKVTNTNDEKQSKTSGVHTGGEIEKLQEDQDIEEDEIHPSTEQAVNELEEETIEIEYEADQLQSRRYVFGEEDELLPIGAPTTENEREDYRVSSEDDQEQEENIPILANNSKDNSLETSYQDPNSSNNASWTSAPGKHNSPTVGTGYEFHTQQVKGQQTVTTLQKERQNKVNSIDFMATVNNNKDDNGWPELLSKPQKGSGGDGGTAQIKRKQTANQSQQQKTAKDAKPQLWQVKKKMKDDIMMSEKEVSEVGDIWMLTNKKRRQLYLYWQNRYREWCIRDIQMEEDTYELLCRNLEGIREEEEEAALRRATVIGMTTSGAARYHDILGRIQPRIVVIEEAAEVLEAHIITSLTRDTQHVIMIGDHKQLRPKPTVYELAQKYNLEISLFERMVRNKMDCKRLSTQHRMRPQIAELTKRIYDHEIINHESVCDLDDVPGLEGNMFFLDHQYLENFAAGLQSYSNKHEALFVVALCRYLLRQGYQCEQITVLTMYTAQLLELKEVMPRREFEGVRLSVVDNFQGEENDIILLSLVRSNKKGSIGFLKESNRICVALSRARQGFYCIGNFVLLGRQCKLWKDICDDMHSKNTIGDALRLVCKKHDAVLEARTAKDFDKFPNGGCGAICDDRLKCGHACGKLCDPRDPSHQTYTCKKLCLSKCPSEQAHPCNRICHHPNECGKCKYPATKKLECGHAQETECGTSVTEIICQHKCEKTLECGHNCKTICGVSCESKKCKVKVKRMLKCDHEKSLPCHQDPAKVECHNPCKSLLSCGHPCPLKCNEVCRYAHCDVPVEKPLPCGHKKTVMCQHKDRPVNCGEKCEKQLDCGHKCPAICSEDCAKLKCEVAVKKTLPHCGHQVDLPCCVDSGSVVCKQACERTLECGHRCMKKCGISCMKKTCMEKIKVTLECAHLQTVRCGDYPDHVTCQSMCEKTCSRDHPCSKMCHLGSECRECMELATFEIPQCGHSIMFPCCIDPTNLVCQRPCTRVRKCGHECHDKCGHLCETHPCKVTVCKTLPCGHKMTLACHVDSKEYVCDVMVEKTLSCGHQKTEKCHIQVHDIKCEAVITRSLPCGHERNLMCHVDASEIQCAILIKTKLPCGHQKEVTCALVSTGLPGVWCESMVTRKLTCGHPKYVQCSADAEQESCDAACNRPLICGHSCSRRCSDDCKRFQCQQKVTKRLPCNHYLKIRCCKSVKDAVCQLKCERVLRCGHPCPGKCCEECDQQVCQKMVLKTLPCSGQHRYRIPCHVDERSLTCPNKVRKQFPCGHKKTLPCSMAARAICKVRCQRERPCKHRCQGICGESCSKYPCTKLMNKRLQCNHLVQMRCCDPPEAAACPAPCDAKLDCGHFCKGKCFACNRRNFHEECLLPCDRILVCSHRCKASCNVPCPPCQRRCEKRCAHGKCRNCCSDDCEPCGMPCMWRCQHYQCNNLCEEMCERPACDAPCPKLLRCGHPCIGLCGENCPTLCRKCHPSKLSAICPGSETDERIRFVQLVDCGHVIEVRRMDEWMQRPLDHHVQLRRCPVCSTPIRCSFRYGNIVKRSLEDVRHVVKEAREMVNEVRDEVTVLAKQIKDEMGQLPGLTYFPHEVRSLVKRTDFRTTRVMYSFHLGYLYSLKNHLEIIQVISTVSQTIRSTESNSREAREMFNPSEQSDIDYVVEGSKRALEIIQHNLAEPQMDLRILSQLHNIVMKFAFAIHLIDAWCNLAKTNRLLGPDTQAKLHRQKQRLKHFVRGEPNAIDLTELVATVNSMREELRLTPLPTPQPIVLINFSGFSRNSWFTCQAGHVYASRTIFRDGIVTEKQECPRCEAMTEAVDEN